MKGKIKMRVDIFKSKFNEMDFTSENDETTIEKFQDEINNYLHDLKKRRF